MGYRPNPPNVSVPLKGVRIIIKHNIKKWWNSVNTIEDEGCLICDATSVMLLNMFMLEVGFSCRPQTGLQPQLVHQFQLQSVDYN